MLVTLTAVKQRFGITNTSEDAWLGSNISAASNAVRAYCKRWLGAVTDSISVANPTHLVCRGHGLYTGDTIIISRSNSTPSVDGTHVITVLDDDTFSIPVSVSVLGTFGYIQRQFIEYYCGDNTQRLRLRNRPVCGISDLRIDQTGYFGVGTTPGDPSPFDDTTLKVEGNDYVLKRDRDNPNAPSKSGIVYAINSVWPQILVRFQGYLTTGQDTGVGNIRITYTAGYMPLPSNLVDAVGDYIAQMQRQRLIGAGLQSEHYEHYSYDLFKPTSGKNSNSLAVVDLKRKLAPFKELVW